MGLRIKDDKAPADPEKPIMVDVILFPNMSLIAVI